MSYIVLTADYCPDPGTPPGTTRTGHMFNIDNKVMYRCEDKWTLIGSSLRVCQQNGQWSGTEPQCYGKTPFFLFFTHQEVDICVLSIMMTVHFQMNKNSLRY